MSDELIRIPTSSLPRDLADKIEIATSVKLILQPGVWTDHKNLYGSALSSRDEILALWRTDTSSTDTASNLLVVLLPAGEFPDSTIEETIAEAIEEDAWNQQ